MTQTTEQVSYQLATKLSPPGVLASTPSSTLRKMWSAFADEIVRIYGRVDQLIRESHPATVDELLEDWENEFDLPDPCVTLSQTVAERRAAVVARATAAGGATKQYFISVASALGISVNISEQSPFEVGRSRMGDAIGGATVAFSWIVTAPASTSAVMREQLECIFERLRPAHTIVSFSYI